MQYYHYNDGRTAGKLQGKQDFYGSLKLTSCYKDARVQSIFL